MYFCQKEPSCIILFVFLFILVKFVQTTEGAFLHDLDNYLSPLNYPQTCEELETLLKEHETDSKLLLIIQDKSAFNYLNADLSSWFKEHSRTMFIHHVLPVLFVSPVYSENEKCVEELFKGEYKYKPLIVYETKSKERYFFDPSSMNLKRSEVLPYLFNKESELKGPGRRLLQALSLDHAIHLAKTRKKIILLQVFPAGEDRKAFKRIKEFHAYVDAFPSSLKKRITFMYVKGKKGLSQSTGELSFKVQLLKDIQYLKPHMETPKKSVFYLLKKHENHTRTKVITKSHKEIGIKETFKLLGWENEKS